MKHEPIVRNPWDANVSNKIMLSVHRASERDFLSEDDRGRLLAHVASCPKCLGWEDKAKDQ